MCEFTKQSSAIFSLIMLICVANASSRRYTRIRWEGEVDIPLDKSDFGTRNPGAKWWGEAGNGEIMIAMQSRLSNILQLHFSHIGEGSQIKVYDTRRLSKKGWKLRRQFVNVTVGSFVTKGKRGVRIIASQDATFTLRYFRGFCPVPDVVTADSCTNKKQKGSTCTFRCQSPQFVPLNTSAITGECRADRSWSEDFNEACISKSELERRCLNATAAQGACPVSSEQLLAIYSEQRRDDDITRVQLNFLGLTLRGSYAQYAWTLPLVTSLPGADVRTVSNDCFQFCIIDSQTRRYKASCGSQPTSPEDVMTTCLMCRYVYDVCSHHEVVA